MKPARAIAFLACTAFASGSAALDATLLPWEFDETVTREEESTTYQFPLGPFVDGQVRSITVEGSLRQTVLRTDRTRSTLELLAAFRELLERASYSVAFQCDTRSCGGFDFRREIDVAPAPDMFVDLGDFRFLSALSDTPDGAAFVTLLVSRTQLAALAQVTELTRRDMRELPENASEDPPEESAEPADEPESLFESLDRYGFAVLESLEFESGSTHLGNASGAELRELARYLDENPDVSVVLVGHTDAKGSLESNVELSTKRAELVRSHLIDEHGVSPERLQAQGIGFLAPRASNASADGREMNRRVEVVAIADN